MNERIRELMTKSGMLYTLSKPTHIAEDGTHTFEEHYVYDKFDPEKFAQLIVQECIEVVLSSDPSPKMIVHEPYRTIMSNIVEHFGVLE